MLLISDTHVDHVTWYSFLGFTWNFLRNWVTYRDHLPLNIFGGKHLSISPLRSSKIKHSRKLILVTEPSPIETLIVSIRLPGLSLVPAESNW